MAPGLYKRPAGAEVCTVAERRASACLSHMEQMVANAPNPLLERTGSCRPSRAIRASNFPGSKWMLNWRGAAQSLRHGTAAADPVSIKAPQNRVRGAKTSMNAVEIEEAISALAEHPFDAAEFPFLFLQAFGIKETTLKRLRKGEFEQVRPWRRSANQQHPHRRCPARRGHQDASFAESEPGNRQGQG